MKFNTARGFAIGFGVCAVVLVALGLVMHNQAEFSENYVHDQMVAQNITFTPVEGLTPDQQKVSCLVENAGKPLTTGAQAECYANEQIGYDLTMVAGGKTYAQISYPAKLAQDKATAAMTADPTSPDAIALQKTASEMDAPVQVMFRGEALRGILLTAYGFDLLGHRAAQAATVCFTIAVLLVIGALVFGSLAARARRRPVVTEATESGSLVASLA